AIAGGGIWAILAMPITSAAVGSFGALARCGWRPKTLFRFGAVRPFIRMSLNLLGFNVINYWSRTIDNLLVGKRLGEAQLGYYSRAYTLMLLPLSQVTGVISSGALPAMARAADDKPRVLRGYLDAMRMIAFVTFPMMTGLTLVADPFVRVVYGEKWAPMIPILQILSMVGVLQSLTNPMGWIFVSQGRTDRLARWGLGACSAIIAALAFGAWIGSTVAIAVAYLVVNAILVPIVVSYAGGLIGLNFRMLLGAVAPSGLATIVMAALVAAVRAVPPLRLHADVSLAACVATGIVGYLLPTHVMRNPAYLEARLFIKNRLSPPKGGAVG
ncbi:MAG TPA: oligosaccharide flippase family protein, partial [Polyangia bacterium]|nr:oligosaccharide flippase family protein [Polyangia bacterium]